MESYCQTDVGLKRNNNQDFVYASDQMVGALSCLWIVADGMGGHAAGDIASRLCVETMIDTISKAGRTGQNPCGSDPQRQRGSVRESALDPGPGRDGDDGRSRHG